MNRTPYIGNAFAGPWLWQITDANGAKTYQAAIGGERSRPSGLRTAWYAGRSMLRRYLKRARN